MKKFEIVFSNDGPYKPEDLIHTELLDKINGNKIDITKMYVAEYTPMVDGIRLILKMTSDSIVTCEKLNER